MSAVYVLLYIGLQKIAGRCQIGRPPAAAVVSPFYCPTVIMITSGTSPAVLPVDKCMTTVCFVQSERLSCFSAVNSKKQLTLA
jgi:hypothetical protein